MATTAFTGDVPENYHAGLGPLLFEPYGEELARRAAALDPHRILETACGTGILTRHLAEAVPAAAIVATDLNEGMLEVARHGMPAGVALQPADMTGLPFADASFDLLACQFGLMFVPDKPLAAREARRVLEPGGTWLLSTWAPFEHNDACRITHETLGAMFSDDPPRFYETPFSLGEPDQVRALLEDASFREVRVELVTRTGKAESPRAAAIGLVLGNPVAEQIRARAPDRLGEAVRAVEGALARRYGGGRLEAGLEALVATGTA